CKTTSFLYVYTKKVNNVQERRLQSWKLVTRSNHRGNHESKSHAIPQSADYLGIVITSENKNVKIKRNNNRATWVWTYIYILRLGLSCGRALKSENHMIFLSREIKGQIMIFSTSFLWSSDTHYIKKLLILLGGKKKKKIKNSSHLYSIPFKLLFVQLVLYGLPGLTESLHERTIEVGMVDQFPAKDFVVHDGLLLTIQNGPEPVEPLAQEEKDLDLATDHFAKDNVIGEGGYGVQFFIEAVAWNCL
ncbi:hypothetical protein ACJX0J_028995, partial [Zea mays]